MFIFSIYYILNYTEVEILTLLKVAKAFPDLEWRTDNWNRNTTIKIS